MDDKAKRPSRGPGEAAADALQGVRQSWADLVAAGKKSERVIGYEFRPVLHPKKTHLAKLILVTRDFVRDRTLRWLKSDRYPLKDAMQLAQLGEEAAHRKAIELGHFKPAA